jgi:serine protease AprX
MSRRPPARWVSMLVVLMLALVAGMGVEAARADHLPDEDSVDVGVALEDDESSDDDAAQDDDDWIDAYDSRPIDTAWRNSIRLSGVEGPYSGLGVTVAVLDTGVTRHPDLGDRVVARLDLTPEGDGFDRHGHGTSMTGIVAGDGTASAGRFRGVAPGARILSFKVASWNGATDVTAVLGALEWIAAHGPRYGVRVVNLSFGTDSSQDHLIDPLNFAVQRLWARGILVVAAAGNRGQGGSNIDKPGDDPWVLTVGAADTRNTASTDDDVVAPFSSTGPTAHDVDKPDLVAPGVNLVSHRALDSTLDGLRPAARVESDYFKSTGTSAATAVVSGVAALMFEADPTITPDEAKAALMGTASPALAGQDGAGRGLVDAAAAVAASRAGTFEEWPAQDGLARSSGLGSIDSSRGGFKPYAAWRNPDTPEQVSGELDVLGRPWDPGAWTRRSWSASGWPSSPWAPLTHESPGWTIVPRPANSWRGMSFDEKSFFSKYWKDGGWNESTWRKYWKDGPWD